MQPSEWFDAMWADAWARASGDSRVRWLVESFPIRGGPVESVSWGMFNGRLCWHGFSTATVPMTRVEENFRLDAERVLSEARNRA